MKNRIVALTALAALVSFASCKKKDDAKPIGAAKIQYVNAAATGANLDIYENNARVDQDVPFKDVSGYRSVEASNRTIAVTTTGTIDPKLLNSSINPPDKSNQTIYLVKQGVGTTNLDKVILTDTISGGAAGKAFIRFINLAPGSGTLQATNSGTIVPGLSGQKAYKEYTKYVQSEPGQINMRVLSITDGTTISEKLMTFTANKYYTVAIVGEPASGTVASSLDVVSVANE